jgi:hypothetical protein
MRALSLLVLDVLEAAEECAARGFGPRRKRKALGAIATLRGKCHATEQGEKSAKA